MTRRIAAVLAAALAGTVMAATPAVAHASCATHEHPSWPRTRTVVQAHVGDGRAAVDFQVKNPWGDWHRVVRRVIRCG